MASWVIEHARSSRSSCKTCKTPIKKGTRRVGYVRTDPIRCVRWYHLECCPKGLFNCLISTVEGLTDLNKEELQQLSKANQEPARCLASITGELNLSQFGGILLSLIHI